ncbi:MAG: hypothetical protein ABIK90_02110 [candidate division WOR-3 bacterium]
MVIGKLKMEEIKDMTSYFLNFFRFKVKRYIIEEVDVIKGYVVYWLDYLGVKSRYKCRLDNVKWVWFSEDGKFLAEFLK